MDKNVIKFKRDTAFRKQFFVPDSFSHPAKMDAQLQIWLVERYTEVGETILDPMAGSGTTMLACGLGRNVILVELEEKFCKMMRDNWEQVRMRPQLGSTMGTCQIIQGDARQLENILCDKIVTSPPYAGGEQFHDLDFINREQPSPHRPQQKQNLSTLPYGNIDSIITSPPYADTGHSQGDSEMQRDIIDKKHTWAGQEYSKDKANIGNLPYKPVDSIITSPPFQEAEVKRAGQDKSRENYNYGSKLKMAGEHPDNISKLAENAYGDIDAVITSPPYEGMLHGQDHDNPSQAIVDKKGLPQQYADDIKDPQQIGNLKSDSYLSAMLQVYRQCYKVLKPRGLMILVTKNFIRQKAIVRLDLDTVKLCEQAGFSFKERWYRELPAQSFWRIIYKKKFPKAPELKYEDILIFGKL